MDGKPLMTDDELIHQLQMEMMQQIILIEDLQRDKDSKAKTIQQMTQAEQQLKNQIMGLKFTISGLEADIRMKNEIIAEYEGLGISQKKGKRLRKDCPGCGQNRTVRNDGGMYSHGSIVRGKYKLCPGVFPK